MKTLIDNVFRKQLKRLSDLTGAQPRVWIGFDYSDEPFALDVSIDTAWHNGRGRFEELREEEIKHMVDILINEYNNRRNREDQIRLSDYGPVNTSRCNTINIDPFVSHWNGEIRDSGTTLLDGLREVCNG